MSAIIVTGSFDDLRSRHVRFLEEASRLGDLHVLLWSDETAHRLTGRPPKFPQAERLYLIQAIRHVARVTLAPDLDSADALPLEVLPARATSSQVEPAAPAWLWAVDEMDDTPARRAFCVAHGIGYRVFTAGELVGFPAEAEARDMETGGSGPAPTVRHPSVIVTGCYDWLHSGHVRFFEEASTCGDLIVVVGNDANVRHLKGEGHPLQTQEERRYMVGAIRYVKQALISTGWDWLDAEPEIRRLKPDIYLVNEDGDRPEKREFCAQHSLQYVVLKRVPKEGLPRRSSTALRGF